MVAAAIDPLDRVCDPCGKGGRRFGGLAADTCGLNVTLREGFWLGIGLIADGEESRGVVSEEAFAAAIVARRGFLAVAIYRDRERCLSCGSDVRLGQSIKTWMIQNVSIHLVDDELAGVLQ